MVTQSIIVYRSPIEAMFWEGGIALPVFSFILAFSVVFVLCINFGDFVIRKWKKERFSYRYHTIIGNTAFVLGLIAAFVTIYFIPRI